MYCSFLIQSLQFTIAHLIFTLVPCEALLSSPNPHPQALATASPTHPEEYHPIQGPNICDLRVKVLCRLSAGVGILTGLFDFRSP
jgi:hypothetical protein